jgi:hypothetical protein
MHSRKFYRTTFIYEVLSEDEPVDNCLDLGTLREVTHYGDCVGRFGETRVNELTGKEAADALYEFGSEPGFFLLDDEGLPEDE